MRTSSVAVRPMMSLALAVSCTPGSCTTTRSTPCCWITGSATPSSLTRLCRVVMFCLSAAACTRRAASGLRLPVELEVAAVGAVRPLEVGQLVGQQRCAPRPASARSRKRTSTALPSRVMPAWRMFLSRSSVRTSPASASAFLVSAAFMSTCIRKCTPPRRSRPRYIGSARSAGSHVGRARQQVQRDDVGRVARVGVERRRRSRPWPCAARRCRRSAP